MGNTPRVHLAYRRRVLNTVTACGLTQAARLTSEPEEVTCGACARTLVMADAEAHLAHNKKRGRYQKKRKN